MNPFCPENWVPERRRRLLRDLERGALVPEPEPEPELGSVREPEPGWGMECPPARS
jgi:hypothetical protein